MDDATPRPDADPGPTPAKPDRAVVAGAAEFLTLGLTVAVALVAMAALGYVVDRWLGTTPWFTLVGLVLGIVAAVLITISRVRRLL